MNFASPEAFEAWLNKDGGKNRAKHLNWQVVQDADGTVRIFDDLNEDGVYQPDQDVLVAVNGFRLTNSHQAQRAQFSRDKVQHPDLQYSQYKRIGGAKKKLSAFNMVAKVVGAALKVLKKKGESAKDYSVVSSTIYKPIAEWFEGIMRKPPYNVRTEINDKGIDLSLAKIHRDPVFKVAILDALNAIPDIMNAVNNAWNGVGLSEWSVPHADDIIANPEAAASVIVPELCAKFGQDPQTGRDRIDPNALFAGLGMNIQIVHANAYRTKPAIVRTGTTRAVPRGAQGASVGTVGQVSGSVQSPLLGRAD
jgi:hypothetical protein